MSRADRFRQWVPWALLAAIFTVMLAVSFDVMDQWISDSRFYLAWSYRYLGYSEADAARMTYEYLLTRDHLDSCGFCWPADYQFSFFHGENGAVVAPRMIYPLVSAPFVALFGPQGMLVVPAISFAVGTVAAAHLATRMWGRWWGVAAGLAMLLSAIGMRFATMAMTDSLALMFNVLGLLFLPLAGNSGSPRPQGSASLHSSRERGERRRRDLLWFLVILVLNLFTRQFAITVAAGLALTWLVVFIRDRQWRNAWLPFALGSAVVTVAVVAAQNFYASRFFQGGDLSLTSRYQKMALERFGVDGLGSIPKVIAYQAREDYFYVRELDLPLVLLIGAAVIALLWRYRSELTALTVGMSVVTLALGALIVDQTYFRYFVPLMPLLVLCVLALLRDLFATGVRPSRSTERPGLPGELSGRRLCQPGPAGLSWLSWIAIVGIYLAVAVQIWREALTQADLRLGLNIVIAGLAVALFAVVAARRLGVAAAVATAVAFSMSTLLVTQSIDTLPHSIALLAVVIGLGLLPGSGFTYPWAPAGFGVVALAAVLLTPRAIAFTAAVAIVALASPRDREWRVPGLIALAASVLGALVATWGSPDSASRSVFLIAKALTTDRILIAVAVIATVTLLTGLRSRLTWLALAGVFLAGVLALTTGEGVGAFQLAAPVVLMAAAAGVTQHIRAGLAAVDSASAGKTQQPA